MKRNHFIVLGALAAVFLLAINACRKPEEFPVDEYNEIYAGGKQTVFDAGSGAFGHEFPYMSSQRGELHEIGDAGFETPFVTAPAPLNPGLGPVYNNVSCVNCHIGDGRGKPPLANEQLTSMLFRISVPGAAANGGPNPVPGFGGQLQQRAVFGSQPEADVVISYATISGLYDDGTPYQLRVPTYSLQNEYVALPGGVMLSPRVAPPVFGLGLLEAIDETTIVERADPGDVDGDGISGKPNYVWDAKEQQFSLGRFGWKCEAPNLMQQTAGAYNEDMGITNYVFGTESCDGQLQHDGLYDESEVYDSVLYAVAFYMRSLAVPARRNIKDPAVVHGKELFVAANCSGCHVPMSKTGARVDFPEVSNQTIFPYTDMLLHDMGPGLADNRPTFDATGQEWRTSPLWGIGLTQAVNGHNNFLHDGRARNLEEAILWHGGEADQSRLHFLAMPVQDRADLIAFLNSL
jgi:CxxC motif-containing protein (DUF1111 family)